MELIELEVSDKENSVKYNLISNGQEIAHGYIFNRDINPIEIFVEEKYQSNGYGKYLFNSLLKILKNNGEKGIIFQLDESNFKMINIIKGSGAVEIGKNISEIKFMLKI